MSLLHRALDRVLPRAQATWIGILGTRLGLLVLAVVLLVGTHEHPVWLGIVAGAFVVVSLGVDRKWPISSSIDIPHAAHVVATAAVVTVVGGIVAFARWGDVGGTGFSLVASIATFAGLAAMFLGAGTITAWLRRKPNVRLASATAAAVVVAVLVGLHGLGTHNSVQVYIGAAGLLLAPIPVALLGELLIREFDGEPLGPNAALIVTIALLMLVAVPSVLLVIGTVPTWALLGALSAMFILVFLITSTPNIDTVVVVIVLAVSWASVPRSTPIDHSAALVVADGEKTFVSIGDSYMSGEGAQQFFSGTNVNGSNECRRAPTAYSILIAKDDTPKTKDLPGRVIFLACSGAVVDDLYVQPQYGGEPVGGNRELQPNGVYEPGETQLDQLRHRIDRSKPAIAFALVSVGGNDVNFGTIVQTCLAPGDCSVFAARWNALVDGLASSLDRAYRRIGGVIPNGRVVVVPYPIPVSDRADCPSATYTLSERKFLVQFTNHLDDVIATEATRHGFLVADTRDALTKANARLCDKGKIGINGVSLNPKEGQLSQIVDPVNWFHDSMHPNAYGHTVIAASLESWLESAPTQRAIDGMQRYRDPGPPPRAATPQSCGSCPKYCTADLHDTSCESRWSEAQIGHAVSQGATLLVLTWLAVSWLIACVVIGRWRRAATT
jgi:hypothetical protein